MHIFLIVFKRDLLVLAFLNNSVVFKISGALMELFDNLTDVLVYYVDVSEKLFQNSA